MSLHVHLTLNLYMFVLSNIGGMAFICVTYLGIFVSYNIMLRTLWSHNLGPCWTIVNWAMGTILEHRQFRYNYLPNKINFDLFLHLWPYCREFNVLNISRHI